MLLGNTINLEDKVDLLIISLPKRYQDLIHDYTTLHPGTPLTYESIKGIVIERWGKARIVEKEEKRKTV